MPLLLLAHFFPFWPRVKISGETCGTEALQTILNTSLSEESSWKHCALPVKQGGLGIRLASEITLPAYLSSVRASKGTTFSIICQEIQQEKTPFLTEDVKNGN